MAEVMKCGGAAVRGCAQTARRIGVLFSRAGGALRKLHAMLLLKQVPTAAPGLAVQTETTAGKLANVAAKAGRTGISQALDGLVKLFGGNNVKSFPAGFDRDTYERAMPHFEAALQAFQDAGKTLVDLFKFLIQQFGLGIKPYAIQFAKDKGLTITLTPPVAPASTLRGDCHWICEEGVVCIVDLDFGGKYFPSEVFAVIDAIAREVDLSAHPVICRNSSECWDHIVVDVDRRLYQIEPLSTYSKATAKAKVNIAAAVLEKVRRRSGGSRR
jgi:hypothetical protein